MKQTRKNLSKEFNNINSTDSNNTETEDNLSDSSFPSNDCNWLPHFIKITVNPTTHETNVERITESQAAELYNSLQVVETAKQRITTQRQQQQDSLKQQITNSTKQMMTFQSQQFAVGQQMKMIQQKIQQLQNSNAPTKQQTQQQLQTQYQTLQQKQQTIQTQHNQIQAHTQQLQQQLLNLSSFDMSSELSSYFSSLSVDSSSSSSSSISSALLPHTAIYELTSVISHISDPPDVDSPLNTINGEHLTAHIKIKKKSGYGEERHNNENNQNQQGKQNSSIKEALNSPTHLDKQHDGWFVFNDFVIRPSSAVEATLFDSIWKQPCVLFYSQYSPIPTPCTPLTVSPFYDAVYTHYPSQSLRYAPHQSTTSILQPSERMDRSTVVAIDCEFVCVQQELQEPEKETGNMIVVRPARLTLARVSVVRGEGNMMG